MTVEQYLFLLRAELTGYLSQEELEDILRYYTEYFEEAGPEREREVMMELGSPQRLAEKILGRPTEENMIPAAEPYAYGPQEGDYIPQTGSGMPRWLFILILVAAAIFAGPVLLGLVFGLGLGGLVCVTVGLGLVMGGVGKLSFGGFLYLGGGGLITTAVGLFLLAGALAAVWGAVKLIHWFRCNFVEGGYQDEKAC